MFAFNSGYNRGLDARPVFASHPPPSGRRFGFFSDQSPCVAGFRHHFRHDADADLSGIQVFFGQVSDWFKVDSVLRITFQMANLGMKKQVNLNHIYYIYISTFATRKLTQSNNQSLKFHQFIHDWSIERTRPWFSAALQASSWEPGCRTSWVRCGDRLWMRPTLSSGRRTKCSACACCVPPSAWCVIWTPPLYI